MDGMPFLLPLLYQLGLGLPAWQSGLLMMPSAAAAITMKFGSKQILAALGYPRVLTNWAMQRGGTGDQLAAITVGSSLYFWGQQPNDGEAVSGGRSKLMESA